MDSNKRVKNIKFFALESIEDFHEERRTYYADQKNPFVEGNENKVDLRNDLVAKMKHYRPTGVSSLVTNKNFLV